MAFTPRRIIPAERRPPSAETFDDIPAMLNWARGYWENKSALFTLVTDRNTGTVYLVTSEPAYTPYVQGGDHGTYGLVDILTVSKLNYRPGSYFGIGASRSPAQNAAGLLAAHGELSSVGGMNVLSLPPGIITVDSDALTSGLGIRIRGVPGQTIIKPALTTRSSLLNAANGLWLEDVILDGDNRVPNAVTAPGTFRMLRGAVNNIQGTATDAGRGLIQAATSTEFYLEDVAFSNIGGYENGVVADTIGAHRAALLSGQNAQLLRPRVLTRVGGSEDGDAFQWQSTLAGGHWSSAGRAWIQDAYVPDFWKRAVKIQASDVSVIRGYFAQSDTTSATCGFAGIDLLGDRNSVEGARVILARASTGIPISGDYNKVKNTTVQNGVGAAYTEGRPGDSLKGIRDSGTGNEIENASIEVSSGGFAAYYTSTSRRGKFIRPTKLFGQYGVVAETGSDSITVKIDVASGDAANPAVMQNAVQINSGVTNWDVEVGSAEYMVNATAITGTASGNKVKVGRIGSGVSQAINTFNLASDGKDTNRLTEATTFRSAPGASFTAPAFELLPGADPTTHFIGTRGDVLANITWRIPNTVVKFDNTAAGVTDFTAATVTGQNTPQSVVSVAHASYPYPHTVEIILGSGTLFQNGSSAYWPSAWFKTVPVGWSGLTVEADYGAGYVLLATYSNITPQLYWRAATPVAIGAAIKLRFTFTGTTPASGSFDLRRMLLYYSQLGDLETDTISWKLWRVAHGADGTPTIGTSISSAPTYKGQMAQVAGVMYQAIGTSSTADWLRISLVTPPVTKTAAYTLALTDEVVLADATSAAFTLTLPTAVGKSGQRYIVKKIDNGTNAVTIATTSSQTIDGQSTYLLSNGKSTVTLLSDGANWQAAGESHLIRNLKEWAESGAFEQLVRTFDGNGLVSSSTVKWPDGSGGTLTYTNYNSTWLEYDGYTISHTASGLTVTQTAITRNASGIMSSKPALTVA